MPSIHHEVVVPRAPEEVWQVVGDFGGLADWSPGIEKCRVEGSSRFITMGAMEVREDELSRDDHARTYTYGLVGSPGVDKHVVTVRVEPEGSGSKVSFDCEYEPADLGAIFEPTYQGAVAALKSYIEG